MIFRGFLAVLLAAWAAAAAGAPKIPPADDAFLRAYDAFRAGEPTKLARASALVREKTPNHVLLPYLDFWRLKLRLEDQPVEEVRGFLEREKGSYLAERLRIDWLRELGKRADWENFDRELPLLAQEDLELRCYAWLSRTARGDDGAYREARAMWLEPRELPEACVTLADRLIEAGQLNVDDVWKRARVLFENGQVSPARRALGHLPDSQKYDGGLFNQAATAPSRLLANTPKNLDRRATREMVVFAVVRLARGEPESAAEVLRGKLGERLPAEDVKYLWGRVALEGARRLVRDAHQWYGLADEAQLNDEQLAWKVRAALRAGDWAVVRDAIDRMSVAARQDPTWIYWYGRALGAQGVADGARAYYLRISGQPTFYGLLAAEELGYMVAVPEPFHAAPESEVEAARAVPSLARSLALYRLELRSEAVREWLFGLRGMDDSQLLAAAELAHRNAVYDRAINTADRTQHKHNYKVRFLAPFREVFTEQARSYRLEEAWVLGLVRQESRFIVNAKSSAGAQGLMQLMPATARWMAKRIGMNNYNAARVADVPVNIALGAGYLRQVLDELGHPVLASAAYNAGPGRARRWRDAQPLEGAIYAETIPFNETRDYVKKVMANTMYYAQLIGGKLVPLKDRLGQIPAKVSGERVNEELP
jgi:soluble lytic murein transglycosylase